MSPNPVLIIGAGVSGLLLAQHLKKQNIPYELFERDTSFTTRGVGWGLTLHWSLDGLKELLPEELVEQLPTAYADRVTVEKGIPSRAPYYDISTGQKVGETPMTTLKVRVTRERFRNLLSTGLDIQWGKSFKGFKDLGNSVTVTFEDGTSRTGQLLVGADGANSRLRRALHPGSEGQSHHLPVANMSLKMSCTAEQCEEIRKVDPYFFSGIASKDNIYLFYSVLDAPGSNHDSGDKYTLQVSTSWVPKPGLLGHEEAFEAPESQEEKYALLQEFASKWTDPFRSFVQSVPRDIQIQNTAVQDYIPGVGFRQEGRVTLLGDACHAMSFYRGEGANHAIYDVFEFSNRVTPHLLTGEGTEKLRGALDEFEDALVKRTRPAVMASRRACLDAHDWNRVNKDSPLFLKRAPFVDFNEKQME